MWSEAARRAALEARRRRRKVRLEPVDLARATKDYESIGHDLGKHNSYLRRDAAQQIRSFRSGTLLKKSGSGRNSFTVPDYELGKLNAVLRTSRLSTLARNALRRKK